jgi:hypothetical protein
MVLGLQITVAVVDHLQPNQAPIWSVDHGLWKGNMVAVCLYRPSVEHATMVP